ncbi:peptide chain release factor 1 [Candidatus Pacearchaeota archaeon]|nr:peptide chain release factor 1 [Candidatus Pacearchaeota archaeon]
MSDLTPQQARELEELIETLDAIKGRHTQLVSVLIPTGQNINLVQKQLEGERSTATNIKSKQTRSAVTDGLDTIIRELKTYKKTPENGLAIYAGNTSEKEGQQNIEIWAIEPPKALKVRMYRCDQTFLLEPLKAMLEVEEVFGLLAIDRQEASIGLLEGKDIKMLQSLTSGVPGKTRAGGQSSQRFHRITEGLAKDFFRRVAESMKDHFFDLDKLKGILIGGPIPTKEEFLEEGQLVTKLKEKVIALKDIGYVDEHGLELLVEESQEDIAEQELIKEKKILEQFFDTLGKHKNMAPYGEEKVKVALERGAVDKLFLDKKLSKAKTSELSKMAENIGASVVLISDEHQDGQQFINLTKTGIGALLRFPIE